MSKTFSWRNISLLEFSGRVFRCGKLSIRGLLLLPLYYLQIIPALPFELLQFLIYGKRIEKTIISGDPVFILGHYRSGTTFLQKLMASDKRFGFLTNYNALFPNTNLLFGRKMQHFFQLVINALKIKNPFFHQCIVQLDEPAEEDDYLMNKASAFSAYWGLIFPKRWREWLNGSPQFSNQKYSDGWKKEYLTTIKYATFRNHGKQLILKNPPNTERIRLLIQMFPKAKFIYISRNPYHLFYSARNMWKRAILNWYSLQKISDEELDEIVFEHYVYLAGHYNRDKKLIPEGNLLEITYEELKANPFGTIQKIYSQLGLPDFEVTVNDLLLKIEIEKDYRNFEHQFCDSTLKTIEQRWGQFIDEWNKLSIQAIKLADVK